MEACTLIIKHWLGECWNSHPICQSEPEGWAPELPRRLIYLGELLTTTVEEIMIIDTDDHTDFQYIAVSYRWPMYLSKNQQLDEGTRDAFYRGYPVSRLHPLYADAFKVAAMLGIKYVWIDALVRPPFLLMAVPWPNLTFIVHSARHRSRLARRRFQSSLCLRKLRLHTRLRGRPRPAGSGPWVPALP